MGRGVLPGRGLSGLAAATRLAGDGAPATWRRGGEERQHGIKREARAALGRRGGAARAQMGFPGPELGSWRAAVKWGAGEDVATPGWLRATAGGGAAYGTVPSGGEEVASARLQGEGGRWRRLMIGGAGFEEGV